MKRIVVGLTLMLALAWSDAASAADRVRFRLNWVPGAEYAPYYLGKEKGFFAAEGIDVEILPGEGSTVTAKLVGNRSAEFGLAGLPGKGPVAARKSVVRESLMTPVLRPARPISAKGSSGRWARVEREACRLPVGKSACVLKAAATGGTSSFPVITP